MNYAKKTLAATLVLAFCFALSSCNNSILATTDKYEYRDVEGGTALYRYTSISTVDKMEVPDFVDGKPVIEIMDHAISSAEYIKTITIGANVEKIGDWAITNCPSLEKFMISSNNKHFCIDENGILYNKDKTVLMVYPNARVRIERDKDGNITKGGEITLPGSVKKINATAFYLSTEIYKVNFNEGLEEVGDYAFMKCYNLSDITLPSTLKKIGTDGFSYCDSLTELEIPASVSELGDYAFFSLASSIQQIIINRPLDEFDFVGKDWIPNKNGTARQRVEVILAEEERSPGIE